MQCLNSYAEYLFDNGRFTESEKCLRESLGLTPAGYPWKGRFPPERLLARVLMRQQRFDEAEPFHRRAVANVIRRRIPRERESTDASGQPRITYDMADDVATGRKTFERAFRILSELADLKTSPLDVWLLDVCDLLLAQGRVREAASLASFGIDWLVQQDPTNTKRMDLARSVLDKCLAARKISDEE